MAIIVVDIQTGGLDSNKHSILGIGMIKCSKNFDILDTIEFNIKHETMVVQPEALNYNRVDIRKYDGWLSEKTARKAFFKFLGAPEKLWLEMDDTLDTAIPKHSYAGMNVVFDILFLKNFVTSRAFDSIFQYTPMDALTYYDIFYRIGVLEEAKSNKLYDIASALGITVDPKKLEQAAPLYCADLARKVFRKIAKRAEKLSELITKHGYSVHGLLETNKAVAKTKRKSLREAREKLARDYEDEED